jgi:hypothetical protein
MLMVMKHVTMMIMINQAKMTMMTWMIIMKTTVMRLRHKKDGSDDADNDLEDDDNDGDNELHKFFILRRMC